MLDKKSFRKLIGERPDATAGFFSRDLNLPVLSQVFSFRDSRLDGLKTDLIHLFLDDGVEHVYSSCDPVIGIITLPDHSDQKVGQKLTADALFHTLHAFFPKTSIPPFLRLTLIKPNGVAGLSIDGDDDDAFFANVGKLSKVQIFIPAKPEWCSHWALCGGSTGPSCNGLAGKCNTTAN